MVTLLHSGKENDWLGGQGGCHQGKGGTSGDNHVGVHLVVHCGLHVHIVHEGNTLRQVVSVGRRIPIGKYLCQESKAGGRSTKVGGCRVGTVGKKVVVDGKVLQHHVQLGFQPSKELSATLVFAQQCNVARTQLCVWKKWKKQSGERHGKRTLRAFDLSRTPLPLDTSATYMNGHIVPRQIVG